MKGDKKRESARCSSTFSYTDQKAAEPEAGRCFRGQAAPGSLCEDRGLSGSEAQGLRVAEGKPLRRRP